MKRNTLLNILRYTIAYSLCSLLIGCGAISWFDHNEPSPYSNPDYEKSVNHPSHSATKPVKAMPNNAALPSSPASNQNTNVITNQAIPHTTPAQGVAPAPAITPPTLDE